MTSGYRFAVVLLLAVAVPVTTAGEGWGYTDSTHWPGSCQTGKLQSPIDLSPSLSHVTQFDKFTFSNYDQPARVNLKNNGHTAVLQLEKPTSCALSGGGLVGVYYLSQIHFHWGAEHTVQGRRLPVEVHMVHYSKKYSSVSDAMGDPQGLAVVGILFKESAEDNSNLDPMLKALSQVNGDLLAKVPMAVPPADFLPGDVNSFYRYQGSLTTPACNESVVWTVMMATLPISSKQLDYFVNLKGEHGLIGPNYRPIQQLNGRTLYSTKLPGSSAYRITPVTLFIIPFFIIFV